MKNLIVGKKLEIQLTTGFPIVMGEEDTPPPVLWFFSNPSSMGHPPLKNEALPNWKTTPSHWKVKPASRKWLPERNLEKLKRVIDTCVSIIKEHWKKMAEIPQERDFLIWSINNFVIKVKLFVCQQKISYYLIKGTLTDI